MTKPLVSVIIPVYNHEKFVQEAIQSIINQTYPNIELLVIDDGSTDSSYQKALEMKEECKERFVRVVMNTKENEGSCATYNKLVNLAQGEYVYLIASDDVAKPDAIESEVDFLNKNEDYVLAVGNNEVIDSEGKISDTKTSTEIMEDVKKIKFSSELFGKYWTLFYVGNYIPNGYLVRRNILNKCGKFTPNAPLEDWWEMLQLSKYGKFKYIDKVLFSYRIHGANTSANGKKMRKMARMTYNHEKKVLKNTDFTQTLPEVKKTFKYHQKFHRLCKFAVKFYLMVRYYL